MKDLDDNFRWVSLNEVYITKICRQRSQLNFWSKYPETVRLPDGASKDELIRASHEMPGKIVYSLPEINSLNHNTNEAIIHFNE